MATNFGFMPVLTGERYFISYKSEDTARVGEITRRLNQMGVPMWYDYGIEKWSREINRTIDECDVHLNVIVGNKIQFGQYPQASNGEVQPRKNRLHY